MTRKTTYTCDRCGAESESEPRMRSGAVHIVFGNLGGPSSRHMDLCQPCVSLVSKTWEALLAALGLPHEDRR